MAQYRKKPVVIEAVRWRGYQNNLGVTAEPPDQPVEITAENMHNIQWEPLPAWLPPAAAAHHEPIDLKAGAIARYGEALFIGTLEGTMKAAPGDWIIRGVKGEIYPCKPEIFAATYEVA